MAERLPLAIAPDANGPRVRLGVLWFLVTLAAVVVSQAAVAVVLAVAAALAADEVIRLHGRGGRGLLRDPMRLPAVVVSAALPLAAVVGTDTLAAVVVFAVVAVLVHRMRRAPVAGAVADVALVLAAALPVGLAGAAPVLMAGLGAGAAIVLLVLVAAYDAGDFLVGTGAGASWEGPVAGVVAVAVCGFGAWVVAPAPIETHGVATLVVVTCLLAPFGPPAASVLIGGGRRPARFVRRLDSLLVVGPVAAWAAAAVVDARLP